MTVRRERLGEIAAVALLVAVAVVALGQSWQRWLDPIVDTGRDLYIPEQLRAGATLYRDVLYVYPPLAPYLLASVTAVTGSSLAAYAGIGIAIALLTAAVLYALVRRTTNWHSAFGATLLFVSCSLAGASTFGCNYVFPYSYAATLTMLFYLGCVLALHARAFPAAVGCAVLAAFTKIDLIPALALLLVYAAVVQRMRWRWLAVFAAASIAAVWLPFSSSLVAGRSARHFYGLVSGAADLPENLLGALYGAIVLVMAAALMRYRWVYTAVAAALGAWLLGFDLFRAWLILHVALLPYAWRRRHEQPLLLLLLASIGATARVLFNPAPEWYGFTLAVPLYALVAHVGAKKVWLIPMAILAATTLASQHERWALKTHPIVTSRGTFYDYNADRAAALNAVLPELAGTRSLVVMPEGLQINYFARVKSPVRFHTFTPPEIGDPAVERMVVRDLDANPPETVLVVTRDVSEFGYRGLGVDYGREITAWLRAHYRVARHIAGPRFSLVRLARYEAAANSTP